MQYIALPVQMRVRGRLFGRRRERGTALIYMMVALPILVGFLSFALDLGRAQLVKTELQAATDAAARYGAGGLPIGTDTAVARALASAAENQANNAPVAPTVETGHWDGRVFLKDVAPTDAVQVSASVQVPMLFGTLLGRDLCTVRALSVARCSSAQPNFIGLQYITAKNNTSMGYDSSLGSPGGANTYDAGVLASNGSIDFNRNVYIRGSMLLGPSGTYNQSAPPVVRLPSDLSYPATENPPFMPTGSLTVDGVMHLPGGTYVYSSILLNNNAELVFDGPTTLYVIDSVSFANNGYIHPASNVPGDLNLRIIGGPTSIMGGSNANSVMVVAKIYAPNTDFLANNSAVIYGSGLFRSIVSKNTLSLYYDIASGSVVDGRVAPVVVFMVK